MTRKLDSWVAELVASLEKYGVELTQEVITDLDKSGRANIHLELALPLMGAEWEQLRWYVRLHGDANGWRVDGVHRTQRLVWIVASSA